MPNATVILPNRPEIADYLDFDELRLLGREHIAKLSGEIWTDHNVHDPGITIMEVLVYAILDIGYRNQLEVNELFARNPENGQEENNFFTAAQILSCNPLTINDYRKLVLDVKGVRNAWFEVSDESETPIGIDCEQSRIRYFGVDETGLTNPGKNCLPLRLNGLYKVYLELEPLDILAANELDQQAVVNEVKCLLWQHRNLGEDFLEIIVLEEEEIAVCSEIELVPDADPEDTLVGILESIDAFLSPSINYYTLKELLDKGKSMDEVFEGRPLKFESNGFIDVDELEEFDRIRKIHLSDLYREIMKCRE